MNFEINNLTRSKVDKGFLKKVGKRTSKILKIKLPEISLVIIGERRIKELNRKYRKKNKVTDVLAFGYGEVFICLPRAKKQADKLGHSLKKELATLLIHGVLHLAGYSDKTKRNFNKIRRKQEELCQKII